MGSNNEDFVLCDWRDKRKAEEQLKTAAKVAPNITKVD